MPTSGGTTARARGPALTFDGPSVLELTITWHGGASDVQVREVRGVVLPSAPLDGHPPAHRLELRGAHGVLYWRPLTPPGLVEVYGSRPGWTWLPANRRQVLVTQIPHRTDATEVRGIAPSGVWFGHALS